MIETHQTASSIPSRQQPVPRSAQQSPDTVLNSTHPLARTARQLVRSSTHLKYVPLRVVGGELQDQHNRVRRWTKALEIKGRPSDPEQQVRAEKELNNAQNILGELSSVREIGLRWEIVQGDNGLITEAYRNQYLSCLHPDSGSGFHEHFEDRMDCLEAPWHFLLCVTDGSTIKSRTLLRMMKNEDGVRLRRHPTYGAFQSIQQLLESHEIKDPVDHDLGLMDLGYGKVHLPFLDHNQYLLGYNYDYALTVTNSSNPELLKIDDCDPFELSSFSDNRSDQIGKEFQARVEPVLSALQRIVSQLNS